MRECLILDNNGAWVASAAWRMGERAQSRSPSGTTQSHVSTRLHSSTQHCVYDCSIIRTSESLTQQAQLMRSLSLPLQIGISSRPCQYGPISAWARRYHTNPYRCQHQHASLTTATYSSRFICGILMSAPAIFPWDGLRAMIAKSVILHIKLRRPAIESAMYVPSCNSVFFLL
jgi:hypothetical protein